VHDLPQFFWNLAVIMEKKVARNGEQAFAVLPEQK